jgi:hypothetical protein
MNSFDSIITVELFSLEHMFVNIGIQEIGQTNEVYLVVNHQCSLKHNISMSSYLFNVHHLGVKTSHNISSWI